LDDPVRIRIYIFANRKILAET